MSGTETIIATRSGEPNKIMARFLSKPKRRPLSSPSAISCWALAIKLATADRS